MSGQMRDLLQDVSRKLEVTERLLGSVQQEQRGQSDALVDIRERLAGLERDRDWAGEERRKVDGRLGSGDHTFLLLQRKVDEAWRMAKFCMDKVQKGKETTTRKKVIWKLLEYAAPIVGTVILQLLYHILMVGPQIAEAIKKAGGHP